MIDSINNDDSPRKGDPSNANVVKVFNYNGSNITFQLGNGDLMINATEMAKPFGKRTNDYLTNVKVLEFIQVWVEENPVAGNPVTVVQGGINQGTWLHEDIALDFAGWLSPKFKYWCNQKIKELLKTGEVKLISNPTKQGKNEIILQGYKLLMEENEDLKKANEYMQPKAEAFNHFMNTNSTHELDDAAQMLNTGRNKLITFLKQHGVFKKDKPLPLQKYVNDGWFITKPVLCADRAYRDQALVTQKGINSIHNLMFNKPTNTFYAH